MSEIRPRTRAKKKTEGAVSPVDRQLAQLPGDYTKLTDAAAQLGCSVSTLRRLLWNQDLRAPSYEMLMGRSIVYLYTPEDITELRAYLDAHGTTRRR